MKRSMKYIAAFFSLTWCLTCFAESNGQVLFDDDESLLRESVFGLQYQVADISETTSSILGAQWGMQIKQNLVIGLHLNSLASSVDAPKDYGDGKLNYYHFGIFADYCMYQMGYLEFNVGGSVASQQIGYRESSDDGSSKKGRYRSSTNFAYEPSISVGLRATRKAKILLGATYHRTANDLNLKGIEKQDVDGTAWMVMLRTGIF